MTYATILTEEVDGILVIAMNRPDRLNAWTEEMGRELTDAIEEGNADPEVMAMVLTGMGRGFCAGADMAEVFAAQMAEPEAPPVAPIDPLATIEAPPLDSLADDGDFGAGSEPVAPVADEEPESLGGRRNWVELVRASKPLVAAVNGPAIGVGLTQILPMDCIVAARGAQLSLKFVKLGLVPELASSHFLPMRVGFGRASDLLLTGRTVDAEEAVEIGLVDRLAEPDELLQTAAAIARSMGENPQTALAMTKELLTENMTETSLHEVQQRELRALEIAYETPEHHRAVEAFQDKQ
ncbi:MAG: enoyl-CoA hydratase-related protein [Actinomycetota bacterium]